MRRSPSGWNCLAITLLVLCLALLTRPGLAAPRRAQATTADFVLHPSETLAVVGITQGESRRLRRQEQKHMANSRIGFGLNHLLAQTFFDTGKFVLFEEKDVQQREWLDGLARNYWVKSGATYLTEALRAVGLRLGVPLLAFATVSHAKTSKGSISIGPFSRHRQKLVIKVDACLYEVSTSQTLCHTGQGETKQEATGVLYEFNGDRLDFENSAAGRAAKQAVTQAVQNLIASIRFEP